MVASANGAAKSCIPIGSPSREAPHGSESAGMAARIAEIGEPLITTVVGLLVAIPAFVAYNFCVSRINRLILEMERAATELANFMCHMTETGVLFEEEERAGHFSEQTD